MGSDLGRCPENFEGVNTRRYGGVDNFLIATSAVCRSAYNLDGSSQRVQSVSLQHRLDLLTRKPHTRRLQIIVPRILVPPEATTSTAKSINLAFGAALIPESTALPNSAVVVVFAVGKAVVVTVVSGEHHPVLVSERIIADVTREP